MVCLQAHTVVSEGVGEGEGEGRGRVWRGHSVYGTSLLHVQCSCRLWFYLSLSLSLSPSPSPFLHFLSPLSCLYAPPRFAIQVINGQDAREKVTVPRLGWLTGLQTVLGWFFLCPSLQRPTKCIGMLTSSLPNVNKTAMEVARGTRAEGTRLYINSAQLYTPIIISHLQDKFTFKLSIYTYSTIIHPYTYECPRGMQQANRAWLPRKAASTKDAVLKLGFAPRKYSRQQCTHKVRAIHVNKNFRGQAYLHYAAMSRCYSWEYDYVPPSV